jgi:hypothetical protein
MKFIQKQPSEVQMAVFVWINSSTDWQAGNQDYSNKYSITAEQPCCNF